MSRVTLQLPAEVQVSGVLRTPEQPHYLDQDMLSLQLPNGVVIDVGWYPDRDPNGEYRLVVFRDTFDQQLGQPIHTKDHRVIELEIYKLVLKHLPFGMQLVGFRSKSEHRLFNGAVLQDAPAQRALSVSADESLPLHYV